MSLKSGISAMVIAGGLATAATVVAQTDIGALTRQPDTTIQGTVTEVFGNKFILEDRTGRVLVSSGPHWYHPLTVREGERVSVNGEIEGDEFDAFTITRQSSEIIAIRPAEGPPPWAGGPGGRMPGG